MRKPAPVSASSCLLGESFRAATAKFSMLWLSAPITARIKSLIQRIILHVGRAVDLDVDDKRWGVLVADAHAKVADLLGALPSSDFIAVHNHVAPPRLTIRMLARGPAERRWKAPVPPIRHPLPKEESQSLTQVVENPRSNAWLFQGIGQLPIP